MFKEINILDEWLKITTNVNTLGSLGGQEKISWRFNWGRINYFPKLYN